MAAMGLIPAGAYRNRNFAAGRVAADGVDKRFMDVLYDPQTSGGLLIAVAEKDAAALVQNLRDAIPCAAVVGYVTARQEKAICIE